MSSSTFDKTIPYYLKAKSADALFSAMVENNNQNNTHYLYYQIYTDGKFHYAWYHVRQEDILRAKINQENERLK